MNFFLAIFIIGVIVLSVYAYRLIPKYISEKKREMSLREENVQDVIFIPSIKDAFGPFDFIGVGVDTGVLVEAQNSPGFIKIKLLKINSENFKYFRRTNRKERIHGINIFEIR